MLELLAYVRANGFKTFIAVRRWRRFHARIFGEVYTASPRDQVIGSVGETEIRDARWKAVSSNCPP